MRLIRHNIRYHYFRLLRLWIIFTTSLTNSCGSLRSLRRPITRTFSSINSKEEALLMDIFIAALFLSAFLCSLVAGFLFAYAIVVMPGIKNLNDREFIRAFQVTDRIIQNNHPLFMLVWVGSAIAIIVSSIYGIGKLQGVDFFLLALATLAYILGVQVSTIAIHLPLNNKLQTIDVDALNEADLKMARKAFEPRWNTSNVFRTAIASCVSVLLIILLFRQ